MHMPPCPCVANICMYVHAHAQLISPHGPTRILEKIDFFLFFSFSLRCPTLSYHPCHITTPCLPSSPNLPTISTFCTCSPPPPTHPPFHICFLFLLSHVCFGEKAFTCGPFTWIFLFLLVYGFPFL